MDDFDSAISDWHNFVSEIETHYGVNMKVLTKAYKEEQERYYLKVLVRFHFCILNMDNLLLCACLFYFNFPNIVVCLALMAEE